MKARVGEMEEKTREVRIRRTSKDVVGYVKYVVGKKNLVVMFEDLQKKEMCEWMNTSRDLISKRGIILSQHPGVFGWILLLVGLAFHTQKTNSTVL